MMPRHNSANIEDFIKGYSTCEDLEVALNNVNIKLADQYNLSDSQIKAYQTQKATLELKIKEAKCFEQKEQAKAQKLGQLAAQLSAVEAQKKAQQQKMLRNSLIGLGVLVVVIVLYKVIKK